MELPAKYDPSQTEDKWYAYWLRNNFFHSEPDEREPYTIVIPPPNVTGVLHMGHMLNNTIQDVLIRKARMQGKNACWVPGTDHASIATEAKVVGMLREKGIKKSDLSREEFLKYAWEWKEKYGGIILEQLKKLGASCDWERTRFTMEDSLSEAVIDVFIDLHKKGLIYRGLRMINWDPQAKTTLSNEEVLYEETKSSLYYVKYMLKDSDEFLLVATVRPETIMGDVAVCVNPRDERYKNLIGKTVIVPMINREVPVIADEYVDIEFGTGALKITPAHDANDYEIGKKFNLPVIDCFNEDGTIAPAAQLFVGEDRFKARKLSIAKLTELGLLEKTEDIVNKTGRSERTNAVIEPRLSQQWFVDMKLFFEKNPQVLNDVMTDELKFYPPKLKNTYKHWIDNVRDWCISRQLWWGQRIPAWYDEAGNLVAVAKTEAEALAAYQSKNAGASPATLKQDEDVLDTWFSSWLWPISVFDGFKDPNNKDIQYYYPTNDLVTAPEIMFFWVMRMIMAGYEWRGEKPFKNVYYTGIVRDKLRRKMSKSLGNSPDPLDLIATYGADGVRMGMLLCSPAGNDILFDEKMVEQGRNFSNKLWNALRLVKGWEVKEGELAENKIAIEWIEAKLNQTIEELEKSFSDFRLNEALMTIYKFIWDDFCSWYLEMIKPEYQKPIDRYTYEKTITIFESIVKVLHPFMPFITEEIYHTLRDRKEGETICLATYPTSVSVNQALINQAALTFEIVTNIRELRAKANKKNTETVDIFYNGNDEVDFENFRTQIIKLARVGELSSVTEDKQGLKTFLAKGYKFFALTGKEGDGAAEERDKLLKELDYTRGFLASVEKKLSNEKFMASAKPQVIESETKKKEDALKKIAVLEQSLGLS
ncbi:MAG: valine--tRNA ligase [Bacteroidetes bacterium]|nr:valine--tRNA ligase [Bacteroidota bacterium]